MKRHLKTIIGVAVSVLLLGWALRDVSLAEVLRELRNADPLLFVIGIAIAIAGFAVRAVRWGILLRPLGVPVAFRPRFAAVIVGFAANNVLPARIGEFARALSLSRITPVSTSSAFATLVVERIFDAVVLISFLFATMASADFPVTGDIGGIDVRAAARVIAVAMTLAGMVLFAMVVAPAPFVRVAERVAAPLPDGIRRPILAALHSFLAGLGVLRSAPLFLASLGLAAFQWWFTAWSQFITMRAFGITEVPFYGALFLQSLIGLAVAAPSSPGFFGPFEASIKVGLGLWGVSAEKSVPFAVGLHLGGFIPVTLMGVYYVARLNLSWREVQHSGEVVEEQVEGPAEPQRESV
jgi:glycosyltransferase 2 family protein